MAYRPTRPTDLHGLHAHMAYRPTRPTYPHGLQTYTAYRPTRPTDLHGLQTYTVYTPTWPTRPIVATYLHGLHGLHGLQTYGHGFIGYPKGRNVQRALGPSCPCVLCIPIHIITINIESFLGCHISHSLGLYLPHQI